jgi:seryl-tRNA synthetase
MLQITILRNHTQEVKEKLAVKNCKEIHLVDEILQIDEERRQLQKQNDDLSAANNIASKQIGILMKDGNNEGAAELKNSVSANKEALQTIAEQLKATENKQNEMLVQLPNLPHSSVPKGHTPEENEVVRSGGTVPDLHANAKPHWEITTEKNLVNFEIGTKITGAGFPLYVDKGAKLQRALINYFLDYNTKAGYIEYQAPLMVNEESAFATGQLPDKEGQMYHAREDNFFMIPTAEVPLTNIFRNEIINAEQMPIKLTGYTPCFRREAGSYGKEVRGLNRLHQFDKIEIVQIVHPNNSYTILEEMVLHVEKLIESLELPYRVLRLCGGDMSFASALTYDFEVYSTAQERWLEVSSVSNFETFQTNRLMCRYRDENGKTQLAHSLNGSSLALPRIVAGLLENHQLPNGSIKIPDVLVPYFGAKHIE